MDSLDTLKLWGFSEAFDLLKAEQLYKKRSYFDFKYDKNTFKSNIISTLVTIFKKDLEIFVALFDPCERFYKTFNLAPKFFNLMSMFLGRTFVFTYLRELCSFAVYERRRQHVYLPLQIKELDKNLVLAHQVLDFFDRREDKPELYFLLKGFYDRLSLTNDAYNNLCFKKNEDPRVVYSVLRCITVNYSDIIKLMVFRIELDRYRRIAR